MTLIMIVVLIVGSPVGRVPVAELDAEAETWTGRQVEVVGELVGDYSDRGEMVWVQLNDDAYATLPLAERTVPAGGNTGIGVRMSAELFDRTWGPPGGYLTQGPIVRVEGVFHHNGAEEQGDTFIAATTVEMIQPARSLPAPGASPIRALTGAALTTGGILLAVIARRRRSPT